MPEEDGAPALPAHHLDPYKPSRQWLQRFRDSSGEVDNAATLWHHEAAGLVEELHHPGYAHARIPGYFWGLTQLLALWCDTELHVEAGLLTDFLQQCAACFPCKVHVPPGGSPAPPPNRPSKQAMEDTLTRAAALLQRIVFATIVRSPGKRLARGSTDMKLEARNKWLYQQCCKGRQMPYANIIAELKRIAPEKGWEPIESIQGIRAAAKQYAASHNKPLIPNRQNL